ncbi:hypothetical protein HK099_006756 [Clydaea vesicula]|uniref:Helicase C-terminal domain-containing protein n=1 Tax=Clydaea vesicula TaxID=447962 RepID=A0AAD5Y2G3_9FUNG|nr:hypothetical protein HK099_006756 [Clydaea vesicula]
MISTTALCYGIDYPNITTVIKIGIPYDFTGYVQLKGRLVRDPSLNHIGNSIIILNSSIDANLRKSRLQRWFGHGSRVLEQVPLKDALIERPASYLSSQTVNPKAERIFAIEVKKKQCDRFFYQPTIEPIRNKETLVVDRKLVTSWMGHLTFLKNRDMQDYFLCKYF